MQAFIFFVQIVSSYLPDSYFLYPFSPIYYYLHLNNFTHFLFSLKRFRFSLLVLALYSLVRFSVSVSASFKLLSTSFFQIAFPYFSNKPVWSCLSNYLRLHVLRSLASGTSEPRLAVPSCHGRR